MVSNVQDFIDDDKIKIARLTSSSVHAFSSVSSAVSSTVVVKVPAMDSSPCPCE